LKVRMDDCRGISEKVHKQTRGNVFFVVQLLRALQEDGVLFRDGAGWNWMDGKWEDYRDVIDLMARRIMRLPKDCQELLAAAACLGAAFDETILKRLLPDIAFAESLELVASTGILTQVEKGERYKFSHDRLQQAAYCLTPKDDRAQNHLSLGRKLLSSLSSMELEGSNVFLVVDQMLRGRSLLSDQDEKDRLAALCLQAGEQAVLSSDFRTAVAYFKSGIQQFGLRHWRDQYDLSRQLHYAVAEASCCTGDVELVDHALEQLLDNARVLEHKLPAYLLQVYALGARKQMPEAVSLGLKILGLLGESFPSKYEKTRLAVDYGIVKRMLRNKSFEYLLRLPDMQCQKKLYAMQILNLLAGYTAMERPKLYARISLKMVKMSLKYGLCAVSARGFAAYGMVLCASRLDIDRGYHFGKLGVAILEERYKHMRTEWAPRVLVVFHSLLAPYKEPRYECAQNAKAAGRIGIVSGDHMYAVLGYYFSTLHGFIAGTKLVEVEKSIRRVVEKMKRYKQELHLPQQLVILEAVLVLMGKKPLLSDAECQPTKSGERAPATALFLLALFKMVLAYHMGDIATSLEMAEKSRALSEQLKIGVFGYYQSLYDALSSLASAKSRPKQRRQLLSIADRQLNRIREFAKHNPKDGLYMVHLIEAEMAALNGNRETAISHYKLSIEEAGEVRCLYVQALAYERLWLFLREFGDESAEIHLYRAIHVYTEWGAHAKVSQLRGRHPSKVVSTT
jgi:predicted ATPase